MNWKVNFKNLFSASKVAEAKDISLEHIQSAFRSMTVQDKWFEKILDKLEKINFELDNLLEKQDKGRIWEALAIERRAILRCLTMILDARDELESERMANETRDRFYEKYKGVSAPLTK